MQHVRRIFIKVGLVMLAGAAAGCGSVSGGYHSQSGASEGDAYVLAEILRTIEQATAVLALSSGDLGETARFQATVASARNELAQLTAACNDLKIRGTASCLDAPDSAATTAAWKLTASLHDMTKLLAFKRRIMPPDDPGKRPARCKLTRVCPHRGGDAIHNRCADEEPPNMYQGCDVLLSGKHFDAITSDGVLWEVKTDDWSKYSAFLRALTLEAHTLEAKLEHKLALSCGHPFVFAVADDGLYRELVRNLGNIGVQVRHVPRCRR